MFKRILFVLFLQGKQESLERAELINLNFLFWCSQAKRFYYVTTALLFLKMTIFTYDICLDSESEILMAVQKKCNFVKTCPWFSRKNLWCDHFVPITRESTLIYAIKIFLREDCPYSELFWFVFSHLWTECGEILRISPYLVQMWENTDQNNSKYGHFLRSKSDDWSIAIIKPCKYHLHSDVQK